MTVTRRVIWTPSDTRTDNYLTPNHEVNPSVGGLAVHLGAPHLASNKVEHVDIRLPLKPSRSKKNSLKRGWEDRHARFICKSFFGANNAENNANNVRPVDGIHRCTEKRLYVSSTISPSTAESH